tara:strand:+ start:4220 stop:5605 length:1386 start_codon:yes stop_codon:yes gene_type:complete
VTAREIAAKYGDRLRELGKRERLGQVRVRQLLRDWLGEDVTASRARKVWDIARTTLPAAQSGQQVEVKRSSSIDISLSSRGAHIRTLDDLLAYTNTDLKTWRVTRHKLNSWQQGQRDSSTGKSRVVQLFQVKADLERRLQPVAAPEPVTITATPGRKESTGLKTCLFLPDPQIGLRWVLPRYERLECLHDWRALDLAVQVALDMQPDVICCLGDFLDLAPFSRFDGDAGLRQTTAPALAVGAHWLASLRAAAPDSVITVLEGNHDIRLLKHVSKMLPEVEALAAEGDDKPALDIRRLLNLDAYDVQWVGSPYDKSWYLWDRIRVRHGSVVRGRGGQTVASMVASAVTDEVCGHIHRREIAARVVYGPEHPEGKLIQCMSPGCLTMVDGSTPGRSKEVDWHQGLGFCTFDPSRDLVSMHSIPIVNGTCIHEGRVYSHRASALQETAQATGWHQLTGGKNGKG